MATPSLNALIEEITGLMAGSRFQDSTNGNQFRTRVTPLLLSSTYQQLSRGEFGYINTGWKNLTDPELASFELVAGSFPLARRLYITANINLSLIDEAIVSTYLSFTAPPAFPLQINELTPAMFLIQASSPQIIVPADTKLLVFATYDKTVGKIFTNPKEYYPVLTFDEGEDLSAEMDIITEWNNSYGRMRVNRSICIKSVLIDKRNGSRGPEEIVCSVSSPPLTPNRIIDNSLVELVDDTGTFITFP